MSRLQALLTARQALAQALKDTPTTVDASKIIERLGELNIEIADLMHAQRQQLRSWNLTEA